MELLHGNELSREFVNYVMSARQRYLITIGFVGDVVSSFASIATRLLKYSINHYYPNYF